MSLSLLHGNQPDVIVVCHNATHATMPGHPEFPLPTVDETIALNLLLGARTNPAIRCGGITINTSGLAEGEASALLDREAERLGLPAADPMRGGERFDRLVDVCLGR